MHNDLMVIEDPIKVEIVHNAALKYYKKIGDVVHIKKFESYVKKELDRAIVEDINNGSDSEKIALKDLTKKLRSKSSLPSRISNEEASQILASSLLICHFDSEGNMILNPQQKINQRAGDSK